MKNYLKYDWLEKLAVVSCFASGISNWVGLNANEPLNYMTRLICWWLFDLQNCYHKSMPCFEIAHVVSDPLNLSLVLIIGWIEQISQG